MAVEIILGQNSFLITEPYQKGRAPLRHGLGCEGGAVELIDQGSDNLYESTAIRHHQGMLPLDRHGLKILGTHYRADPGPADRKESIIHNIGQRQKTFSCRPDCNHKGFTADPLVIKIFFKQFFCLDRSASPVFQGRDKFDLVIHNRENNRGLGLSLYDNHIESGKLQFSSKMPSHLGAGQSAG